MSLGVTDESFNYEAIGCHFSPKHFSPPLMFFFHLKTFIWLIQTSNTTHFAGWSRCELVLPLLQGVILLLVSSLISLVHGTFSENPLLIIFVS